MPNPHRLTVRWLSADAFPRCRVVAGTLLLWVAEIKIEG